MTWRKSDRAPSLVPTRLLQEALIAALSEFSAEVIGGGMKARVHKSAMTPRAVTGVQSLGDTNLSPSQAFGSRSMAPRRVA